MSYIPNNAMPHAYDEDAERPDAQPEGERSIFRWVSEKARNNPRTAISAGAAILAGAVAAVAIPLMGGEEKSARTAKSGTARKASTGTARKTSASKTGTARSASTRKSAASAGSGKSKTTGKAKSATRAGTTRRKAATAKPARGRKPASTTES